MLLLVAQTTGTTEGEVSETGWDVFIEIASQVTVLLALLSFLGWLLYPRVTQLVQDVAETRRQVTEANAGTHLRDIMTRVEHKVDRNSVRLSDVEGDMRDHRRRDHGAG